MTATTARSAPKSSHIETATDSAAFSHWPDGLYEEMKANEFNGCVGSVLVSETDRVRVWHLMLPVATRCTFHRHVNPYFWSAHNARQARGYFASGTVRDATHFAGETRHYYYGPGEYMVHSVENIGDTDLAFTTVEFLDGTNQPLEIPESLRLRAPAEVAA